MGREHRLIEPELDAERSLDRREGGIRRCRSVGVEDRGDHVVAAVDAADEVGRFRVLFDIDFRVADPGFVELRLESTAVTAPRCRVDREGRWALRGGVVFCGRHGSIQHCVSVHCSGRRSRPLSSLLRTQSRTVGGS